MWVVFVVGYLKIPWRGTEIFVGHGGGCCRQREGMMMLLGGGEGGSTRSSADQRERSEMCLEAVSIGVKQRTYDLP